MTGPRVISLVLALAIGIAWAALLGYALEDALAPAEDALAPAAHPTPSSDLRAEARLWIGTPHKMGGRDRAGVDCSGLVLNLMETRGVRLPRRAEDMRTSGIEVDDRDQVRPGDLLFFETTRGDGLRGHVGLALSASEFVHATGSKGVIVSLLDSPYWGPRLLEVRRVLP